MRNKYLEKLILNVLGDEKVKIVLFDSKASQDNLSTSDVDIDLIPYGKINKKKFYF